MSTQAKPQLSPNGKPLAWSKFKAGLAPGQLYANDEAPVRTQPRASLPFFAF
jgi:hypothetical protein